DTSGRREIQPRFTYNGNAWFVRSLKAYPDALQEMNALKAANNKNEATFNSGFKSNKGLSAGEFIRDSSAYAKLTSYHPDTMRYEVNNANNGYLVFSEIFYDDWRAEIDGKPVTVNKVDYTLRGIPVPAGKHNVKLYFDKGPESTNMIEKTLSIAILIGMLVLIAMWLKSYTGKQEA
ncbi:MAG TPA: YfhO family protein, partial [Bacteroidia bacterium]